MKSHTSLAGGQRCCSGFADSPWSNTGGALGALQYLLPAVRNSSAWDVLIGHYLGMDHVGHTHSIHHPEMTRKLRQMDDHIRQVSTSTTSLSCLSRTVTEFTFTGVALLHMRQSWGVINGASGMVGIVVRSDLAWHIARLCSIKSSALHRKCTGTPIDTGA